MPFAENGDEVRQTANLQLELPEQEIVGSDQKPPGGRRLRSLPDQ